MSVPVSFSSSQGQNQWSVEARVVEKDTNTISYEWETWATVGDSLTIRPTSNVLLFYPQFRQVDISASDGCLPLVEPFQARPGLYPSIDGFVFNLTNVPS